MSQRTVSTQNIKIIYAKIEIEIENKKKNYMYRWTPMTLKTPSQIIFT